MEDRADVAAALKDVRLVISEGEEDPAVSGLAVAQAYTRVGGAVYTRGGAVSGLAVAQATPSIRVRVRVRVGAPLSWLELTGGLGAVQQ